MAAAAPPVAGGPAPPTPVVANVMAAPFSSSLFIMLDADTLLVLATPYLDRDAVPPVAGTPSRVQLSQRRMLHVFFERCDLVLSNHAFLVTFQSTHMFTLAMPGAAWGRVLTELVASGLLAQPIADLSALIVAVRSLTISTPANLLLTPSDFLAGEAFDTPPAAAVPGVAAVQSRAAAGPRGRAGHRPAVPAVAAVAAIQGVPAVFGPADLHFLTFLDLLALRRVGDSAPMAIAARLAPLVGACLTRAYRLSSTALARLTMSVLRLNLERRIFGAVGQPDAAVALQLLEFLPTLVLPPLWHSASLGDAAVLRDLSDTVRYTYGTAEDRRAVETCRLSAVTRCASLSAYNAALPSALAPLGLGNYQPCCHGPVHWTLLRLSRLRGVVPHLGFGLLSSGSPRLSRHQWRCPSVGLSPLMRLSRR